MPYIDSDALTWWQEFNIYKEVRDCRTYINIDRPPVEKEKIYECPLIEAKHYQNLLNDLLINNQSDIARDLGITRARVSLVMSLLKLAPEIQKTLLDFKNQKMIRFFSEYRLRPLLSIMDPSKQIKEFNKMKRKIQ